MGRAKDISHLPAEERVTILAQRERMRLKRATVRANATPEQVARRRERDRIAKQKERASKPLGEYNREMREYRQIHLEEIRAAAVRRYAKDQPNRRARANAAYAANPRRYAVNNKRWKKNNRAYFSDKRANDPQYALSETLRNGLYQVLISKGNRCRGSAVRDLGCTLAELKAHIEAQFDDKMTWDNRGYYGWHIDHVIPCAAYNLQDREQFLRCVHYSNLRPLWGTENRKKKDKLPTPQVAWAAFMRGRDEA